MIKSLNSNSFWVELGFASKLMKSQKTMICICSKKSISHKSLLRRFFEATLISTFVKITIFDNFLENY